MKGLLIRVGIDKSYGGWNAPVDTDAGRFLYAPIPELSHKQYTGLSTTYRPVSETLKSEWPGVSLPEPLLDQPTHLDPDFEYLTYGDNGHKRGKSLAGLQTGDFVAFYSGMRPLTPARPELFYGLIGFFRVGEVVEARSVESSRRHENAHTRRSPVSKDDVIIRGAPGLSGRFSKAIRIGGYREKAYRVFPDLLDLWGGLSCKDGFIQRSAVPPSFSNPEMFLNWLSTQSLTFLRRNY